MIQLTRSGAVARGSLDDLARFQTNFTQHHCVRIRQLVQPQLLNLILRQIATAEFYERIHEHGGVPPPIDMCMKENMASDLLHFLTNDPTFLTLVQRITGCERIGSYLGVVYRLAPGKGHYDSWHDDVHGCRIVAMSLNLSAEPFSGGLLQIRERSSGLVVHEVANTGAGGTSAKQ